MINSIARAPACGTDAETIATANILPLIAECVQRLYPSQVHSDSRDGPLLGRIYGLTNDLGF
jgi:hypothetical protein